MLRIGSTLTPHQRIGYVVSLMCLSSGWLFFVAGILEWRGMPWSRAALGLQGAALLVALGVGARGMAPRLIIYPLVLAASTYIWDTTLPPPTLPSGWLRTLIPSLVLVGLLLDYAGALLHPRHRRHRAAQQGRIQDRRDEAVTIRGRSTANERRPLPQFHRERSGANARTDDAASRQRTPPWWQLYGWVFMMGGLWLGVIPHIPPAWDVIAQGTWCVLTLGGMIVWVWGNRAVLQRYDETHQSRRGRRRDVRPADAERTIPLTPVQRRFLAAIERYKRH